jgi:hemerythrin
MSGIIIWEGKYSIGLQKIDDQHKKLFEFLNFYYDSIALGTSSESTKVTLENLIDYASYHFKDEEKLMSSISGADFSSHFNEHKFFIMKVTELQNKLPSGKKITYELFDFMKEWVLNHILISDKKIEPYL